MDPTTELTLLETAYASILSGGIKSYAVNGRMVTKLDLPWITTRMDQLRAIIFRQTNGMCSVGRFRNPE